ncbi:MAG: SpoIIIAH-like family protein [Eubacteriales bacterium]
MKKVIAFTLVVIVTVSICLLTIGKNNEEKIYLNDEQAVAVCQDVQNAYISFSYEMIDNENGLNYFVNYRIRREQFRQESKDMLSCLLDSDIPATREEAQKKWLLLNNEISVEGEIENSLKIRGFKDVVSDLNGKKVSVIVYAEHLEIDQIDFIKNTVVDIAGVSYINVDVLAKT